MIKYDLSEDYINFEIGKIYYNESLLHTSYIYKINKDLAYQFMLYKYGAWLLYYIDTTYQDRGWEHRQWDLIIEEEEIKRIVSNYFPEILMEFKL